MRPRDADRGNGEKCPEECAGGTRPSGPCAGRGTVRGARFRFFVLPDVVGGAYAIERGLLAEVDRRDDGWRFRGERLRSPVVSRARPGARRPPGAGRPGARVSESVARARSLLERARGLTETIGIGRSLRGPGRTRRHRIVRTAPCRRKSHPCGRTRECVVVSLLTTSYPKARGRTQMRAVVPWSPSNVRSRVTRYDPAQKGTTPRPDVRPGAPTYDLAPRRTTAQDTDAPNHQHPPAAAHSPPLPIPTAPSNTKNLDSGRR